MKIFTDTNVLVSAFISRGLCADLLEIILADHILMTGEFVLNELKRVFTQKLNVPEEKVTETLRFLRKHHVQPLPKKRSEIKVSDEDDRWVLESAIRARADMLVTGDKDLLDIAKNVSQLKIISPRGFWEMLQE